MTGHGFRPDPRLPPGGLTGPARRTDTKTIPIDALSTLLLTGDA